MHSTVKCTRAKVTKGEREGLMINRQEVTGSDRKWRETKRGLQARTARTWLACCWFLVKINRASSSADRGRLTFPSRRLKFSRRPVAEFRVGSGSFPPLQPPHYNLHLAAWTSLPALHSCGFPHFFSFCFVVVSPPRPPHNAVG